MTYPEIMSDLFTKIRNRRNAHSELACKMLVYGSTDKAHDHAAKYAHYDELLTWAINWL